TSTGDTRSEGANSSASPRHSPSSEAREARNIISSASTRARRERTEAAVSEIPTEPFTPKTIPNKWTTHHHPIESPPVSEAPSRRPGQTPSRCRQGATNHPNGTHGNHPCALPAA